MFGSSQWRHIIREALQGIRADIYSPQIYPCSDWEAATVGKLLRLARFHRRPTLFNGRCTSLKWWLAPRGFV